jgi:hypothetical protein
MLAGHHLFHYPINLLFSDYLMVAASASYLLIFPLTWLVVSFFIFHFIYGLSSFPTDVHIFQDG